MILNRKKSIPGIIYARVNIDTVSACLFNSLGLGGEQRVVGRWAHNGIHMFQHWYRVAKGTDSDTDILPIPYQYTVLF